MLNLRQGTTLALSSAAPLYSAAVTAPLVVPLVGGGAPIVYALAMIPVALVCYGMACNSAAIPDKGTVYTWGLQDGRGVGWFGGFSLALTGIIATSGLAYVAVDTLAPAWPVLLKVLLGLVFIGIAQATSLKSVQLTSTIQILGVVVQIAALLALIWESVQHGLAFSAPWGGPTAWAHATVLAVFAYWGFDAIFALTEESEEKVPAPASFLSIGLMFAIYALYSGLLGGPLGEEAAHLPIIQAGIAVSAFMSLGSTLLPTARGLSAMAERGDLPARLSEPAAAALATTVLSMAWLALSFLWQGLFQDSIEALSIFVGLYFIISSASALRARRGSVALHAASLVIMTVVVVLSLTDMLRPDYGTTRLGEAGGVGLLALALIAVGLVAAVVVARRSPAPQITRIQGES